MEPVAIYVVALDGTPPRALLSAEVQGGIYTHWSPAWSPDGRLIAFIDNFALATIGVDGRDLKFLGARAAFESDLDWSLDGEGSYSAITTGTKTQRRRS